MQTNLNTLGEQLKLIDCDIMDLTMKRMQLARQVGFCKYLKGDEISRPSVEDKRIAGIREYAQSMGLNPNFAASLLYSLIDESCKEQMVQLQRGSLLSEHIDELAEYGHESLLHVGESIYKAIHLHPKTLSPKDRDYIFDMIYPVAQSAFGQIHSDKFAHDVRSHVLDHSEILIVQDSEGKAIAFRVWDVFSDLRRPIIYLAGMCVSLEHQKSGIGSAMIRKAIDLTERSLPDWGYVVLRTQNWAMQKSMAKIAKKSGIYQKFGDKQIEPDIKAAALVVSVKNRDFYFDPEMLVSRKIYGDCLYGSDRNFQNGFDGLDVASGDAAYCVWRR